MAPTPESDAVEEETVNSTILYCADTQTSGLYCAGMYVCPPANTKKYESDALRPQRQDPARRQGGDHPRQMPPPTNRQRALSASSRPPLLGTPSAREPRSRWQQAPPLIAAAPESCAEANAIDTSFLSRLPQILDQMRDQQQEMQIQLTEMRAERQRQTLPGPPQCHQQLWQYLLPPIPQEQIPMQMPPPPTQYMSSNPILMNSLLQQAMQGYNTNLPTQVSTS